MADNILPEITDELKACFWAKVERTGDEDCWVWTASACARGYGRIAVAANGKRRPVLATHISLAIHGSNRPKGAFALHSCDNPPCVNPNHLRWGNNADNTADRVSRGRNVPTEKHSDTMRQKAARGPSHGFAKLSTSQVEQIIKDPRIHREIAADYGITRGYVGELKAGHKRKHG